MDPGGFAIAILPVVLSPGASFTLAMNSALTSGARGVLTIMAGTALGIFTHALLVGLGITAALTAFPSLFGALKIAGTIYLLWLGCRLIRGGLTAQPLRLTAQTQPITLTQACDQSEGAVALPDGRQPFCRQHRRDGRLSAAGVDAYCYHGRLADDRQPTAAAFSRKVSH